MNKLFASLAGLIVLLILGSSMVFIVDQRQHALVFGLGEIKRVISEPGLDRSRHTGRLLWRAPRAWGHA